MPEGWTLPAITPWNEAWFTSGTLAMQRCTACSVLQHPPEEICHACGGTAFDHEVVPPTGVVHSYTVVHHAVSPALADAVPYAVVLVSLDAAPHQRVVGNLDAPLDTVDVGLAVTAYWDEREASDGSIIRLPQWRPV
jgi:uncharacterized OB-fold protein